MVSASVCPFTAPHHFPNGNVGIHEILSEYFFVLTAQITFEGLLFYKGAGGGKHRSLIHHTFQARPVGRCPCICVSERRYSCVTVRRQRGLPKPRVHSSIRDCQSGGPHAQPSGCAITAGKAGGRQPAISNGGQPPARGVSCIRKFRKHGDCSRWSQVVPLSDTHYRRGVGDTGGAQAPSRRASAQAARRSSVGPSNV